MVFLRKSKKLEEEIRELEKEVEQLDRVSQKKDGKIKTRDTKEKTELIERTPLDSGKGESEKMAFSHRSAPSGSAGKFSQQDSIPGKKAKIGVEARENIAEELMPMSEELLQRKELPAPEKAKERMIRERSLMEVEGPVFVSVRRYREILNRLKEIENATFNLKSLLERMKANRNESVSQFEECIENLRVVEERIGNITRILRV